MSALNSECVKHWMIAISSAKVAFRGPSGFVSNIEWFEIRILAAPWVLLVIDVEPSSESLCEYREREEIILAMALYVGQGLCRFRCILSEESLDVGLIL
ncbi:hypothetical protein O9G_005467 [Rozella allomycis CSF55]|uniref:Uncharacterized protein n=1 Tax=Rozella allomycis (strain CSF55) TaxID=988480 RepID=A0A075AZE8_ROZAC|nr:hypothetical protein O9G_005467 [Rozella allomycis CSF55]|eukprot:EPZ35602.1 hypothetical protein O9G_005467 [Rozella allomycis CSF55]